MVFALLSWNILASAPEDVGTNVHLIWLVVEASHKAFDIVCKNMKNTFVMICNHGNCQVHSFGIKLTLNRSEVVNIICHGCTLLKDEFMKHVLHNIYVVQYISEFNIVF